MPVSSNLLLASTAVLMIPGFFLVPLIGIFIDLFGNRITLSKLLPRVSVT